MSSPNDLFKMSLFEIAREGRRMEKAAEAAKAEPYKKITELEIADILTTLGDPDLRDELMAGIEVEKEHGRHGPLDGEFDLIGVDEYGAAKIAAAHIAEIRDYYTRLAKMEEEGKKYWANKKKGKKGKAK